MNKKIKTAATVLGSAAVGAGIGVLFAPKSGKETREDLKKCLDSLVKKAQDLTSKDVKATVLKKVDKIELALRDLEKEHNLKVAKKKALKLERDALKLVEYVKKQGEISLEDTTNAVHQKAIEVTRSLIEKIEN